MTHQFFNSAWDKGLLREWDIHTPPRIVRNFPVLLIFTYAHFIALQILKYPLYWHIGIGFVRFNSQTSKILHHWGMVARKITAGKQALDVWHLAGTGRAKSLHPGIGWRCFNRKPLDLSLQTDKTMSCRFPQNQSVDDSYGQRSGKWWHDTTCRQQPAMPKLTTASWWKLGLNGAPTVPIGMIYTTCTPVYNYGGCLKSRNWHGNIHHFRILWLDWTNHFGKVPAADMGMDQYLLIPFLVGWTSIYQLFWCSPGVQGFDTLPCGSMLQW